uniref:Fe_hyd_lg_C domain-containing protein n=1 Tax=Syphacia muris TaxID=451379 RepID=A0A0N5AD40_9BILA
MLVFFSSFNTPLFISINEKELSQEFDINMFVYCSLDIVDELTFKSYGYVSNTNVKMLLVTDIGNVSLKDQDIRAIFKRLHSAYCDALSNPFYTVGEPMKSKFAFFTCFNLIVRLMDEGFSGIIRISNANDYIAPSQDCIIPLRNSNTSDITTVKLHKKKDASDDRNKTKVTVSLNDCLACTGCVTSAETVLMQDQTISKFLNGISRSDVSVVTISPQSLCSLAIKHNWTVEKTAKFLAVKLKTLGATYVIDSSFGRYFTLEFEYKEFVEKHRNGVTVLSSVCPGFVCYAEKVHGKFLLPYLSRIRSPQAFTGSLVKDYLARKLCKDPAKIFHATIMPCFDKKLEASRSGFNNQFHEVDCVISTREADSLFDNEVIPSSSVDVSKDRSLSWLRSLESGKVIGNLGEVSGGYATYIVKRFLQENSLDSNNLRITERQKDLEVIEVIKNGQIILTVAKCYGFRNIQNLIQKLKRRKCSYDYVEVMACPSGCINGGGQIRGVDAESRASILHSVKDAYSILRPTSELENLFHMVESEWTQLNESWCREKWVFTSEFHAIDNSSVKTPQSFRW